MEPTASKIDNIAPLPPIYGRLAWGFLILAALLVGLVVYVSLARAKVIVLAEPEEMDVDFMIEVSSAKGAGDVVGIVTTASDTLSRSFPSTDSAQVEGVAEVPVRITSTLGSPQALVATTRLQNPNGVLFRLKNRVDIPAAGSVDAIAYADQSGAAGEIGMTTFVIPGLAESMQKFFKVETLESPSGGLKALRAVTQVDYDSAVVVLEEELESKLKKELQERAKQSGQSMDSETVTFSVMSKNANAKVGDQVEDFEVTVAVIANAVFYRKDDLLKAVRERVMSELQEDKTVRSLDYADLKTNVEKIDPVSKQASVRVQAVVPVSINEKLNALNPDRLVGVKVEAAEKYLEDVPGVSSASVSLSPFWAHMMPKAAKRITVEVR